MKGRRFGAAAWMLAMALTASALGQTPPKPDGPLSPRESLARLKVAPGLAVDLVLSEPEIAQPVFLNFDERGRLWVVEYRQYPEPAGLKMLSRDGVWRVIYDKVPLPPPQGDKGADRITIHEDADGDGTFEKHKTFVDGLNIATACAQGRGGVWVLNPPYLLFYPDKDRDDRPDGDPEVHLEGFGLEDTHSVVNSLCWGPDGWLYAAQGSTVTGKVKRSGTKDAPVHSMGQLVWRYHPESRRYEVFAEGGGNAFGIEFDAKGRVFSGHNGGDTRGFHYVQGAYLRKGFDKHGPLSNPYAFGYFANMKHPKVPRFTHNFIIYDGGALPREYDGKLLGVAPLLSEVPTSEISRDGSTFQTKDVTPAISSRDAWFRPVDIKLGPDGGVYVADWYDGQTNHYRNHEGKIDRSNGRIYRLRSADAKPTRPFDLASKSTDELIDLLSHRNKWFRRTALRLLGDRRDPSAVPRLLKMVRGETGQLALESLWALNASDGFNEAVATGLLDHADPYVRVWTVRLLGDSGRVSPTVAAKLADLAKVEKDVEVRSQLACSARRLPGSDCLSIVRNLIARDEDVDDPHLPLLLWWAIEAKAESDRSAVLALAEDRATRASSMFRSHLAERIMRRYATAGTRKDLLTCAELLKSAPDAADAKRLMAGFELAMAGRSIPALPSELTEAMARFPSAGGSTLLGLRQGRKEAVEEVLRTLADEKAEATRKIQYVRILGEVRRAEAVATLVKLATVASDPSLQGAALTALQRYDDPDIGPAVIGILANATDDIRVPALSLLVSRPVWARQLLEAADAGKLDLKLIPRELTTQLARHRDPKVVALVGKLFGAIRPSTSAELQAEIERLASRIRAGSGDPRKGEKLFLSKCSSCHSLFGSGGKVGPDLTTYRREDLDGMLLNIVNPSAEIREGYGALLAATTDGRVLTGILMDQDPQVVVLRGSDGRDVTIARGEIEEMKAAPASMMPEGTLKGLSQGELQDLFAYLRATQPPK